MEQGMNQQSSHPQQQPEPAILVAAGEMKAPAVAPQQPKPAAPATPAPMPWPVVFTPMTPASEVKSLTPKKRKHCNCKNSKCLKMYCECFAEQIYCDGCNCSNCGNNMENENVRKEAIQILLARNPLAFQPKIQNGPSTLNVRKGNSGAPVPKHNKGCHCKKSGCLKKYCECYQANVLCSKNCRCMDCKNFDGSEERKASIQGEYASDRNHIQQAANIALNGTIGSSDNCSPVRRKRSHENALGGTIKREGSLSEAQFPKGNHADVSLLAPSSTGFEGHNAANSQSKSYNSIYRSPLANTIHLDEVNGLVKELVTVCRMAAEKIYVDETAAEEELHANDGLSNGNYKQQDLKEASPNINEMDSHWSDTSKDSRPASPTTQALMCDEQDTTFENDYRSSFPSISCDQNISEINAVQENLVLTRLRDYLRLITTRGKINEHKYSTEAAMELDARQHHGAIPSAFSPVNTKEKITSSNGIGTHRINQQPTLNDGSEGNNGS